MKKNKTWIIIISILVVLGILVFAFFKANNNTIISKNTDNKNSNYEAEKSSTNTTNDKNQTSENTTQDNKDQNKTNSETTNTTPNEQTHGITENDPQFQQQVKEEQIAIFSTKIYSQDSARQNNISITCSTLNNTTVKNGETFSFCQTVGQSTTQKGYKEADIYDNKGNKKKGLGGGNCQVSTTLYNAVLSVSSLKVTERHEHSNYVPYIQDGKDAAVAYGSYDLKFINQTGNDIKIYAETNNQNVTIRLNILKPI